jgi:hypothetical protein
VEIRFVPVVKNNMPDMFVGSNLDINGRDSTKEAVGEEGGG